MAAENRVAATNGDVYIPMEERTGEPAIVYFTRDLSGAGIAKIYERVNQGITGKVAIKLHTGEPKGPNFTPASWIKEFVDAEGLADARVIECNTAYPGGRYTSKQHRETIAINGWTEFFDIDICDENADGSDDNHALLPVKGGKWFDEMSVGGNMLNYDSLITLTHFKGHGMGGFGGSNKNLGIGAASGHEGKVWVHADTTGKSFGALNEELMEKITESTKATIDFFGEHNCYINIMRNMSVDCDCAGVKAAPVVTPNVGILASLDICAVDTACVDVVWAMKPEDNHDLKERIQSRRGLRQLTYMQELGMGSMNYTLIDIDNGDVEITPADAVIGIVPFEG